ncbi:SRPBCC family protein [Haloferax sp. YSMS24]|uniref:SRPBCC family protein n=1 Tax=unclassified Haloferax TaxID=2625095 RepID=UPI00398D2B4D
MGRELTTSIEIDAPPERVWDVLVDFDHYDEWNPFMRIAGRANVGATLVVHLMPPGGRESVFEPDVTRCEKHREFRWLGHLVLPGLFDGEHQFRLEPLDGGDRTRLVHAETFSGILAGLIFRFIGEETKAGFEAMNEALKIRVERLLAMEEQESAEL